MMRRPLERASIQRRADAPLPLPAKVRNILRKYNATLLLPGPAGNPRSGFQPGNHRESTGQTLAAVDQQVGLVLDAAGGSLGTNTVANGNFVDGGAGWSAASGFAFSTGALSISASGGGSTNNSGDAAVVGRTYYCEVVVPSHSSGAARLTVGSANGVTMSAAGVYRFYVQATSTSKPILWCVAGGTVMTISSVSVREVSGAHVSMATSGYQPYLRMVPKKLGPELISNGGFDNADGWNAGAGWSVAGGSLSAVSVVAGQQANQSGLQLDSEKAYAIAVQAASMSGSISVALVGGTSLALGPAITVPGSYSYVTAPNAGNNAIRLMANATSSGVFDNISIREVIEWTIVWQFDGLDDRLTFLVTPLASTDDFYQAFALRCVTSAANKTFADLLTNPVTGARLGCLRITGSNILQVVHANDGGQSSTVAGSAVSDGQLIVVEALRSGINHTVFADGVTDIQTTLAGNFTTTHATLGARGQGTSEPFPGQMHAAIVCKGNPTEGERAVIRRFLGQLQGRTL